MLFSVFLITALALFSHSSSALSVPASSALKPDGTSSQSQDQQSLQMIVSTTIETLQLKQTNIENCVKQQDTSISITVELEAFVLAFQTMVQRLTSCGCASKELVNVGWYKETIIGIFTSVQIVIEIIFGSHNKSWILLALKLCTMIDIHVSQLIDISIRIDVETAVAVRDNVRAYIWAYVRVDIVELIDNKVARSVSGKAPVPLLPPTTPSTSPKDGN